MKLPGNIPVAAESLEALMRIGNPWLLRANAEALVVVTNDPVDPCIVWASPKLKSYRSVWDSAAAKGFVEDADTWGPARRRITSMRPRAAAIPPDGSRGNPFGSPDTRAACSDSPRWAPADRSEERRVGKECRSRWAPQPSGIRA